MKQSPLISIVIPVYNLENYIGKCLESVVGQSYRNLEIVVVDDGSRDSSREVIANFAAADTRIKPVFKANGGVSMARLDGIAACTGEYVFFLDGDDQIDQFCIVRLWDAIGQGCEIACASLIRVRTDYSSRMPRNVERQTDGRGFLKHLLRHDVFGGVIGVLYKRTLLENLQFYDDIPLWEDFLMNLQIAVKSNGGVCFVDESLYYYVQRPGSGNRQGVGFEYLQKFSRHVSQILACDPALNELFPIEILIDRVHWYTIYISKSRNPWIGDSEFARDITREVKHRRRELKSHGVRPDVIRMILVYRRRVFRPLWLSISACRRWRKSLQRRFGSNKGE